VKLLRPFWKSIEYGKSKVNQMHECAKPKGWMEIPGKYWGIQNRKRTKKTGQESKHHVTSFSPTLPTLVLKEP
jgi:hypothetical protein